MTDPVSRRYAHFEGITYLCFDSNTRVVTCGHDCDVRIMEGDDSTEFSVSSDKLSAIVCYHNQDRQDVVAVAMDDYSVQAFKLDGSSEGLLMRFTAPVTYLAVNSNHTLLAAGSSEFVIKVMELADTAKTFNLIGHEAPVLCVKFDPKGELLASSSCDGSLKIWSLTAKECVETLSILQKCNDISLIKSLCCLSWQPKHGKTLAVPVGNDIKVYDRSSWKCLFTLSEDHHKEAVNVVSWSPCGRYVASGGADGSMCLWDVHSQKAYGKYNNENGIGITSLEWDPRGCGARNGEQVAFADREGYVGVFEDVYPSTNQSTFNDNDDTLADDSLLMEGIPPDDIFDNFDDPVHENGHASNSHGNENNLSDDGSNGGIAQSRKRKRIESEGATPTPSDLFDDAQSVQSESRILTSLDRELTGAPPPKRVVEFNEKLVQVVHDTLQPSATPDHLQHRYMVYNLVGVVHCHSDNDTSMVEIDFHNTGTHHSFSLSNFIGHSMAALNEQALVMACERAEDQASQLQCVHFSSWDSNKEWTISLPSKESCLAVTIGDGWIAMATNKQMIRLFMVGGVQREIISLPGKIVTVVGWGGQLAVVYQSGLGTSNMFSLTVWVLDVQRKTQLHSPHILPLSHRATLEWIGFSEEGLLISYDSKGIVRILSSRYGGLSWIPILDTTKQLGNKSDHYFIVGMTHKPSELRAILCRGLSYPPVYPKPVMSTLQLKLPLCEMNTEKSELEQQYHQMTMLISPFSASENITPKIQQLMKLFALACKSDREYRAYEIAAMLPDEHSMNLALTYASRTQHLRLARQISDLIQQRCAENLFSDGDEDDLIGHFDADSEEVTREDNLQYVKDRSDKLKQGVRITSGTNQHLKKASSSIPGVKKKIALAPPPSRQLTSKITSKSNSSVGNSCSNGNHHDESDADSEKVCNETKELFSEAEDSGNEGRSTPNKHDSGEDIANDEGEFSTETTPYSICSGSGSEKRHNPFKMATPVSKKVQLDRRSSFLDNINTRVSEVQRNKEKKKESKEKQIRSAGRINKSSASNTRITGSKKLITQTSLKGSFFKQRVTTDDNAPLEEDNVTSHEKSEADNDEKDDSMDTIGFHGDMDQTMTSKQKLSAFSFNSSTS